MSSLLGHCHGEKTHFWGTKKEGKHPAHVRSTEQRYNEIWNSASFVCGKTWLCLKKWPDGSHSKHSLQARKLAVNGRLLLRLHDTVFVGHEQHALQPLVLAVVSEGVFCDVAHARVCNRIVFCLVFGVDFNIMSALFVHQLPTLPQIIDSRVGLFWCKLGLVCECDKMNVYLKIPPFTPDFGLFAAKWSAFCC